MALVYAGLTIPPAAALNAVAAPRTLAAAGARALVPLTYGTDRVPALILNVVKSASDASKVLVQCLWGYACHAVDEPRLNDQALPAGCTATHYTGSQSMADSALLAAFNAQAITYVDTLAGYAYSVFALPVLAFDGQLNFSARVAGRKLYDPRLDSTNGGSGAHRLATPSTWAYSDNPALALADWLYSTAYGAGEAVLWASVITAANHCDALIGAPAEKRRTVGVTLSSAADVPTVADALRAYAGCWLVPTSGGIKLLPDADGAAAASYAHASGQIAALDALALKDLGNVPTVVDVIYTDTTQVPYRDATATAQVAGAGSTLPWRLSTVRLPGVQRYSQAYREAVERLNKLQLNDLSTQLEVFDAGIAHDVGDIVNVSHPLGLAAKPFRITDVDMPGPGRWRLQLVEHDPAAYSTAVVTTPTYADTSRVSPAGPPSDVTGLAAAVVAGGARIYWTPAPDVDYAETELRVGGASWAAGTRLFRGRASEFPWLSPAVATHTVRAKHFDDDGLESVTAASIAVTVNASGAISWADIGGPNKPADNATANPIYAQTTAPTGTIPDGAIWFDSDDKNRMYVRTAGAWVSRRDQLVDDAFAAASNAQDTADGKIESFYQAAQPASGMALGDLWFDTDDSNKLYRYNGSDWVAAQDARIGSALNNAATAQATADGKVTTFFATATPTALALGDLWYSSSTALLKRWDGGAWVTVSNSFANTNQLVDGAGLGNTSTWAGVSGVPVSAVSNALFDLGRETAGFVDHADNTGYNWTGGGGTEAGVTGGSYYAVQGGWTLRIKLGAGSAFRLMVGKRYRVFIRARRSGALNSANCYFGAYNDTTGAAVPGFGANPVTGAGCQGVDGGPNYLDGTWRVIDLGILTPNWGPNDSVQTYFGAGGAFGVGAVDGSDFVAFDWIYFQPLDAEAGATNGATWGVNIGGSSKPADSAGVVIDGYRGTNPNPQDFPTGEQFYFKAVGDGFAGPAGAGYGTLRTVRPYGSSSDLSGGAVIQWFESNGLVWSRKSQSATTWSAWEAVPNGTITAGNASTYVGGGAIGTPQLGSGAVTQIVTATTSLVMTPGTSATGGVTTTGTLGSITTSANGDGKVLLLLNGKPYTQGYSYVGHAWLAGGAGWNYLYCRIRRNGTLIHERTFAFTNNYTRELFDSTSMLVDTPGAGVTATYSYEVYTWSETSATHSAAIEAATVAIMEIRK